MVLNLGPSHPSMHGTLRVVVELDGETIHKANIEIGFLHCGFEKLAEYRTYNQWLTATDRIPDRPSIPPIPSINHSTDVSSPVAASRSNNSSVGEDP